MIVRLQHCEQKKCNQNVEFDIDEETFKVLRDLLYLIHEKETYE